MPLYTVSTRTPLTKPQKDKIAMMITDVHCGHTGAPRTFVQVVYWENVPLHDGINLHIFAGVRAGRTLQVNDDIEQDMVQQACDITGIPLQETEYLIFPVPAKWIMEGGVVLPDPGDEEEWFKANPELAELERKKSA